MSEIVDPLAGLYWNADDATVYIKAETPEGGHNPELFFAHQAGEPLSQEPAAAPGDPPIPKSYSYSTGFVDTKGRRDESRILVCRCNRGKHWSATVRTGREERPYGYSGEYKSYFDERNGYRPSEKHKAGVKQFLFSVKELASTLYSQILNGHPWPPKGLFVVTASTGAAKSQVARGVIFLLLQEFCRRNAEQLAALRAKDPAYPRDLASLTPADLAYPRKPHLVTYEDPIEKELWPDFLNDGWELAPFDYTPRQENFDVKGLKQCLGDALRQTPSIVFIGEVRNPREWPRILEFAGTGHLVVTTAHAGSLREALARIFGDKVDTAGRRSAVVRRLLAVTHLVTEPSVPGGDLLVTYPALYRKTPTGMHDLISDGLASVLPNCPSGDELLRTCGSLGRRACLTLIRENHLDGEAPVGSDLESLRASGSETFLKAFQMDLLAE